MALDIAAAGSVNYTTVSTVATTVVRITAVLFDFDDEWMALDVVYGIDSGGFQQRKSELWLVSGPPLATIMTMAPTGNTRIAVFRDFISDIATRIQTTAGLKQLLIDAGNLIVREGATIKNGIGGL